MPTTTLTWRDVPGHFDFMDLYTKAVAAACNGANFVEIGTLFGKSTCFMAKTIRDSGKQVNFDSVDSFQWSMQTSAIQVLKVRERVPTALWETLNALCDVHAVARYFLKHTGSEDLVRLIPASGQDRVSAYADGSLDFVFIDAEHTYSDTAELLWLYLPKLKHGGLLAGHDYTKQFPDVIRAVADVLGPVETLGNCFMYYT